MKLSPWSEWHSVYTEAPENAGHISDIFSYQKSAGSFPYCIRGTFVWTFAQVSEVEHEGDFCFLFKENIYIYYCCGLTP